MDDKDIVDRINQLAASGDEPVRVAGRGPPGEVDLAIGGGGIAGESGGVAHQFRLAFQASIQLKPYGADVLRVVREN